MTKEILFEATIHGETIDIYVTRKKDIMIEASEDGYIDCATIEEAAHAKGFNSCFDNSSKRSYAKSCHFNNILITKKEYDEDDDSWKDIECFFLSSLRKSPAKLKRFLK